MKIRRTNLVSVADWDGLVMSVYGRPYAFQQQDGCKGRGTFKISVPGAAEDWEGNGIEEMGVSFADWLRRDPEQKIDNEKCEGEREMWWHRRFYPNIAMVANDLHARGLLPAGEYVIEIDW